jgi:protein TonB
VTRAAPPPLALPPDPPAAARRRVLPPPAAGRGRAWPAALASVALHGAVLGGVLLLLPEMLKPPEGEQGVEMVWQEVAEDSLALSDAAGAPLAPPSVEGPAAPEATPSPEVPPPPQPSPVAEPVPERPPTPAPPLPQVARVAPPPPQVPRVVPPPVAAPRAVPPPPVAPVPVPAPAPQVAEAPPAPPETPAELAPPPPESSPPEPRLAEAPPPEQPAQPPAPATEAPTEQAEALPPPPPPMPMPAPMPSIRTAELRPPPARPAAQPMRPMPGVAPLGPPGEGERQAALVGASRATGAVVPPGLLDGVRNAQPEYPSASRLRGEQGVVALVLKVSADGHVTGVEIGRTSGFPQLDEAARKAAQRWRFRPASRDGVPVEGTIRTQVHFRLVQ